MVKSLRNTIRELSQVNLPNINLDEKVRLLKMFYGEDDESRKPLMMKVERHTKVVVKRSFLTIIFLTTMT